MLRWCKHGRDDHLGSSSLRLRFQQERSACEKHSCCSLTETPGVAIHVGRYAYVQFDPRAPGWRKLVEPEEIGPLALRETCSWLYSSKCALVAKFGNCVSCKKNYVVIPCGKLTEFCQPSLKNTKISVIFDKLLNFVHGRWMETSIVPVTKW